MGPLPAYDPEYINEEQVSSSSHEAYHPVAIQIASSANVFDATTGYQVKGQSLQAQGSATIEGSVSVLAARTAGSKQSGAHSLSFESRARESTRIEGV